ncbi:carboxylesterase/lipase family protein [Streptomyces sp. NPDC050535]|uniref:carboxylesterase/lipase family protein n=1 Tax=Streptomyces sp. NPDC050535 TaxID=3365626 RepID=UPI00378F23F5
MTSADPATVNVTTTSGPVRGRRHGNGSVFLDVPYAAPPVGRGRFAAPSPHEPWTGVRDATQPGPTAPQPTRDSFGTLDMSPYFGPGWQRGDDYLTMNIWAPPQEGPTRPVMVFVHGGGFVAGSGRGPLYDGSAFARDGVVLITVNYRLGIPGFLHLADAPDNRGMLDVLAALRWVRENVARFGGDPGNVTLFGQSAGAIIVGGVLADPASSGLVRRAIIQSGTGIGAFTPEQAGMVTAAVGRELDLEPTVKNLAGIPDERLVAAMAGLTGLDLRTSTHHDPLGGITSFSLVGEHQPAAAVADGRGDEVDLLIGANLDEGSLYLAPLGLMASTTDADVRDTAARFHSDPDETVRAYRAQHPSASAADLRTAILGDGLFGSGTRQMAAAHASAATGRTYCYEFGWRSDAMDGQLGASHVMELPFVFDRLALPSLHGTRGLLGSTEPPARLAADIHRSWIRFAETGNPGWPVYERAGGHVQQLGVA